MGRMWRYLLVVGGAIISIMLFLLASASENSASFEQNYPWLLGLNALVTIALLTLVGLLLTRLYRRFQRGEFGSRLMTKLVFLFAVIGIYGGYLVGVQLLGVSSGTYFGSMTDFVDMTDIRNGLYKSLSFGLLIAFLSCFKGYHTGYGAEGVSKATTEAVVLSSVAILVLDYFLNSVLL